MIDLQPEFSVLCPRHDARAVAARNKRKVVDALGLLQLQLVWLDVSPFEDWSGSIIHVINPPVAFVAADQKPPSDIASTMPQISMVSMGVAS